MTKFPEIFEALCCPFAPDQVKVRKHDGAHYITARSAMNRLDEVLGPENWTAESTPWGDDAVYCRLTITLPDGSKVTKADVGANAQMSERQGGKSDPGDDDKAGVSDALKRAAVQFGVGRYLYNDGVPRFRPAPTREAGDDPAEPEHLQPAGNGHPAKERRDWPTAGHGEEARRSNGSGGNGANGIPRTGGALFAWCKEQDEKYGYGLLKYISGWAKREAKPERMKDFDAPTIDQAYKIACNRMIQLRQSAQSEEAISN